MFGKVKNWSWCQSQKLTRRALGFIGRTERLQDYGRPVEGNREEYPVFSPGRGRKEVSGKKTFQLQLLRFDLVVFFELIMLINVVFFPSVIFSTPCLWSNTVLARLLSNKVSLKTL